MSLTFNSKQESDENKEYLESNGYVVRVQKQGDNHGKNENWNIRGTHEKDKRSNRIYAGT